MSSKTVRLAMFVLGGLSALVAQELTRTPNSSSLTAASPPEPDDQNQDQIQPIATHLMVLTQAVAQPERLPVLPVSVAASQTAQPNLLQLPPHGNPPDGKQTKDLTEPLPPLPDAFPPLPPLAMPEVPIPRTSIEHLPIESIVAASLQQSPAPATTIAKPATTSPASRSPRPVPPSNSQPAQVQRSASTPTKRVATQPAPEKLVTKQPTAKPSAEKPVAEKLDMGKPDTGRLVAGTPGGSSSAVKAVAVQPVTEPSFPDIANHRSRTAIATLVQRQILQGFPDGTFRPDAPITDQEFTLMLERAFQRRSATVATIQRPRDVVTRAQAAELIYQQLQRSEAIVRASAPTLVASRTPTGGAVALPETVAIATVGVRALASGVVIQPASVPVSATAKAASVVAVRPQRLQNLPPVSPPPPLSPDEEAYTLGPGDRIRVEVLGVPEYSRDYQVLVNGSLNLYLMGQLRVQGMTLKQLEDTLTKRYVRLVRNPRVDVSLTAPRPLSVAIAGEISRPGAYTVDNATGAKFPTVTRLIQQAGGMTQTANPSLVQVRRPQRNGTDKIITVDLWELFKSGDIRQDLVLRDGDMVLVPPAETTSPAIARQLAAANFAASNQSVNVAVLGEVARPGPYVLAVSTGSGANPAGTTTASGASVGGALLTVTQAIQQAGGITSLADIRQVQVTRTTRSGVPQVMNVNLWELLQGGDLSQDLVLQQGDTITIPKATALTSADAVQQSIASFSPSTIRINVVGEVMAPGAQQLPPNTTVNQAVLAAGGFNKRARKRTVDLIRLNPNGTVTRQEVTINFDQGIDDKGNPLLRHNDIIVVKPTGLAKFSDTVETIATPIGRLLPFFFLF